MKKEKIKFDRIRFRNRWKMHRYSRPSDWTIVGLQEWWAGPEDFCYRICFFGLDVSFWFKRIFY